MLILEVDMHVSFSLVGEIDSPCTCFTFMTKFRSAGRHVAYRFID